MRIPGFGSSREENGTLLTQASFWRIIWSPVGPGHLCYITTGDGESPTDLRIALVDSEELHEYLVREVLGTFNDSYAERPFTVVPATFRTDERLATGPYSGDLVEEYKEFCRADSDEYNIELVWRDFYEPFQLDTPTGGDRNPFGVTSFFIPARSAEVIVNGESMPGNVYPRMRGPGAEQHCVSGVFGIVGEVGRTGQIAA